MLITFSAVFAAIGQGLVYAVVALVCALCVGFFGFILVVCALDWWRNRPRVIEPIPFVRSKRT